jgi:acyl dehydratase
MSTQLYWEDVQVGQEVPHFIRRTDLMNWNRWAAAYDEFVSYHMDDEGARANGQPAVIGQGRIRVSYLHTLLRKWMGDEGFIVSLSAQMRGINFKNDVLTCTGRVKAKRTTEDGRHLVDVEMAILNQLGEIVTPGEATVRLPSRGGA